MERFVYTKNSWDDTLNHVLRAWTFRTHDPQFSNPDSRPNFQFSSRLTPLSRQAVNEVQGDLQHTRRLTKDRQRDRQL